MKVYIIRFNMKNGQGVFGEIIAGTEADAREEFMRNNSDCEITSSHEKPFNVPSLTENETKILRGKKQC